MKSHSAGCRLQRACDQGQEGNGQKVELMTAQPLLKCLVFVSAMEKVSGDQTQTGQVLMLNIRR